MNEFLQKYYHDEDGRFMDQGGVDEIHVIIRATVLACFYHALDPCSALSRCEKMTLRSVALHPTTDSQQIRHEVTGMPLKEQ